MPFGYIDNFAGGMNEREPRTIDEIEVQDCLNVVADGGVFRHAPLWKQLTATLPADKQVVTGVTRQDGSTVLVFWSNADQYEYGILNEAGDSISDLAPLWRSPTTANPYPLNQNQTPLTVLTEPAPVHGVYTPNGTVLVCEADGYWPFVVFNYNDGQPVPSGTRLRFGQYVPVTFDPNLALLLEEQDIRYRQAEDYRVGVQAEERLFSPAVEAGETNNWDPEEDGSQTVTKDQFVIISSSLPYNFIDIRFAGRNRNLTGVRVWIVDINGGSGFRNGVPQDNTVQQIFPSLNNINNFIRMQIRMDWDERLAQPSLLNYNQRRAATIGTGQNRIIIQFQFADGTSDEDKTVRLNSLDVRHNQYLRLVCDNKSPHLVTLHRNRVVFAFEDTLQFSPYNRIKRWEPDQEYFREGGTRIKALQSHRNFLAVFMDTAIHAVTGNSYQSRGREKLIDYSGTENPLSTASDLGYLAYEDHSNNINMLLTESDVRQVLKHVEGRLERTRGRNGKAAFHVLQNDSLILIYHDGDRDTHYVVDPETLREDRGGGWKVSVFPFTGPSGDHTSTNTVKASWSSLTRIPFCATANHIYRLETNPAVSDLANRQVQYLLALHPGGPPSGYQIQRLVLDIDDSCAHDLSVEYINAFKKNRMGQLVYPDAEITRVEGSLLVTVPYSIALLSVDITCAGPRLLRSYAFEYKQTGPGSLSLTTTP